MKLLTQSKVKSLFSATMRTPAKEHNINTKKFRPPPMNEGLQMFSQFYSFVGDDWLNN